MKNLVSVIIPTYNREKTICRAIQSALTQTYDNIEVIVVDDCSTDNTIDVVKKEFHGEERVKVYKLEKNSGACVARNKGVQLSQGFFLAFLDSDDEFVPEKIAKQVIAINESKSSICASDYTIYYTDGSTKIEKTHPGSREEVYKELLYCNFVTTGTLFGYRECFDKVPFDESLPRYQDWDLVLRLCKHYKFCFIQETTLFQHYQHESISASTNHNKTLNALKVIYTKNIDGYRTNKRAYAQIHWLMGLHSLFVKGTSPYRHLFIGALYYELNWRRISIIVCSLFNKTIIHKNL